MLRCRRFLPALPLALLSACAAVTPAGPPTAPRQRASAEQRTQLEARCLRDHAAAKSALTTGDADAGARAAQRLMGTYKALVFGVGEPRARKSACGRTAAETVGQVAQMLHAKAPGDERAFETLVAWVAAFARGPGDVAAVLVLAKMCEERRRWAEAARAYTHLVGLDAKGKHAVGAAHAAVAMWSRARGAAKKEAPSRPRRALTRDERDYLRAMDRLLLVEPSTALRPELLFRKAQLLDGVGQSRGALPFCEEVVTRHERSSVAPHAALLLLDILSRQKAEQRLMRWVERLSRRRRLARGELGAVLQTLRLHVMRREAQAHADARRYDACAAGYLALARARGEKRPDLALFNAAACQQSAGNLAAAIATRERLVSRFSRSKVAPEALMQNGKANATLGKAASASRSFERFARRYPGHPGAPGALVRAINVRLKAGQMRAARALLKRVERQYAARFPRLVVEARKVIEGSGAKGGPDATVKPR